MTELRRNFISFADTPNLDAFGRQRVSNPTTLFDSTFLYDLQPLIFEPSVANGATITHSPANASALLSLDGTAGGSAILQSKQYHRYVPGKSQLVEMTGLFGADDGNQRRVGYFDANDGIYFEQDTDGTLYMVRRTSTSGAPVNNEVAQAAWNIDALDGSGPSGLTLDTSKVYIFGLDFQWLGMGRVRVGFNIDGALVPVHEFLNANVLTTVYMRRGALPVRWELTGDVAASMLATCATVQSEGGDDTHFAYRFSYDRATISAGSGTQTHAFSVRPKATFNGITNRMLLQPLNFRCMNLGSNPVLVEVYYGTTVGGAPSWADMDATFSGLQVDTAGTPSGGLKVASFWAASSTPANPGGAAPQVLDFTARYPLTLDIAGTGFNHFTVYVTGVGGASNCRPGLAWKEDR
jgi:hypothetical protein